jgi:hypothetical protein
MRSRRGCQVCRPRILQGLVELFDCRLLLAHVEPTRARVDGGARVRATHQSKVVQGVGLSGHLRHLCHLPRGNPLLPPRSCLISRCSGTRPRGPESAWVFLMRS